MVEDGGLDLAVPSHLHLVSAFLAMEPSESLISLARVCGGGFITEAVQRLVWDRCIRKADGKGYAPYLKIFLKKLINEIELNHGEVLDELYELYAHYVTLLKDDMAVKENSRVLKYISFHFPDDCSQSPSFSRSLTLVIPLQCSLNMLEGDTGCSIWPSSLFLSEFILSCPEIFHSKSCFEVVLSDGDLSTLANMKRNLELNQLSTKIDVSEGISQDPDFLNSRVENVKCIYLPWESAPESELKDYMPDIVLGADVIYDPLCLPHFIRVLTILLDRKEANFQPCQDVHHRSSPETIHTVAGKVGGVDDTVDTDQSKVYHPHGLDGTDLSHSRHGIDAHGGNVTCNGAPNAEFLRHALEPSPVAYIACVIRNVDTFDYFLALADQAGLTVLDITEKVLVKLFDLLPYMHSYNRSSIRLFTVSCLCK
ncbi:uncharacterized protein LOC131154565 isoform X2 [Malania oleifera]|uniref:uncharacterized protein LOC131154565 isoform X2 n=1 Tax=Malania oleifera TaxID=397392 RepID=UPI0025ADCF43|nr:uncharacterized protein LOC131154565 isoform X2 [Malania oleifera]